MAFNTCTVVYTKPCNSSVHTTLLFFLFQWFCFTVSIRFHSYFRYAFLTLYHNLNILSRWQRYKTIYWLTIRLSPTYYIIIQTTTIFGGELFLKDCGNDSNMVYTYQNNLDNIQTIIMLAYFIYHLEQIFEIPKRFWVIYFAYFFSKCRFLRIINYINVINLCFF